ncbi:hypothetical protein Ddye_032317 [Dipteronia dyeriana]|uniref:SWIM-type domain-containing protein n=1 Tax=Dipteronia dyeriana TaxID=168575 RepID=A0AAD9TL56_9ROSI|nr:hypothetical protein Ddye_032317 [Dipteronia dyeriana]
MRHNLEWKVKRSNKTTIPLVCLMDNCTWKLRAVMRDEGTYFQVRSFINKRTCHLEKTYRRHRQASAVIIGEVVAPRLQQQDGRLMRPKNIIADMKTIYGIQILYRCPNIDDLVFIFDRHASIEAGISKVFPDTTHTICCWHFFENVKKRFHKNDVATIMDKAARSYTECNVIGTWKSYIICTRMHSITSLRLVHTSGPVYIVRKEEFIRNMLQMWFHDRYRVAQSVHHQLTDATHLVILKRVDKCGYMTVNPVDWNIFSVKQSGKQWIVDLARKTCTCKKFQMDMFPCLHALAAARREGEAAMYFFTSRDRKYLKGKRSNRAVVSDFWKATASKHAIGDENNPTGYKSALVYHQGLFKNSTKTDWLIQEYTLPNNTPANILSTSSSINTKVRYTH